MEVLASISVAKHQPKLQDHEHGPMHHVVYLSTAWYQRQHGARSLPTCLHCGNQGTSWTHITTTASSLLYYCTTMLCL